MTSKPPIRFQGKVDFNLTQSLEVITPDRPEFTVGAAMIIGGVRYLLLERGVILDGRILLKLKRDVTTRKQRRAMEAHSR